MKFQTQYSPLQLEIIQFIFGFLRRHWGCRWLSDMLYAFARIPFRTLCLLCIWLPVDYCALVRLFLGLLCLRLYFRSIFFFDWPRYNCFVDIAVRRRSCCTCTSRGGRLLVSEAASTHDPSTWSHVFPCRAKRQMAHGDRNLGK